MKARFFSKFDWAAFWTATLVSFAVYFYTIGPSVGLEDSGELATAAAHLGVPHPPGYPFWTLCSWIFCKLFAGVTYMGHPTPAWAVSLCSAFFGAFAAGCTAMLICRSAHDLLATSHQSPTTDHQPPTSWLCFAGGVGGALAFAFSPVEWSQSTIVEIYSLNALFLMLVFLLSYRWMCRPSDKVLWWTAFVFGLGLTNYQVLLFAIVPLAIIIALRNISLFRDFALYLVPVLLTYQILQIGELQRSQCDMKKDVIEKQAPVGLTTKQLADKLAIEQYMPYFRMYYQSEAKWAAAKRGVQAKFMQARAANDAQLQNEAQNTASVLAAVESQAALIDPEVRKAFEESANAGRRFELTAKTSRNPSQTGVVLSLVVLVGALLAGIWFKSRKKGELAEKSVLYGGGAGAALLFLSGTLFTSAEEWSGVTAATAPLAEPAVYVLVGVFAAVSVVASVAAFLRDEPLFSGRSRTLMFVSAGAAALAVLSVLVFVPSAQDVAVSGPLFGNKTVGYQGEAFPWMKSTTVFLLLIVALFALASFVKKGLCFAIPVAGFHIAAFLLLRHGAMNGLVSPASWWFWWPVAWNFVVLALAWHVLPNGRSVAGAAFFTQLGVSFYAYMPIVSDLRNPPMNWGYPRTWDGFKHAITRGQYEAIKAEDFAGVGQFVDFLKVQMGHYFDDVKLQFTDLLALLAAVPFACWAFAAGSKRAKTAFRVLWVVAGCFAIFLLRDFLGDGATNAFWRGFDRFFLLIVAAAAFIGVVIVGFRQFLVLPAVAMRRFVDVCRAKGEKAPVYALMVLAVEIVVAPLAFKGSLPLAMLMLLVVGAFGVFVSFLPQMLALFRRVRSSGWVAYFEGRDVSQQWLLSSGACFLMMSVLLIILAKVQGDIQDGFIQKVKFISSHAMIAMWIGYGLVFAAALVVRLVPPGLRRMAALALVPGVVAFAALPPLVQNYTNDRLVLELGGSEQNGHTFGWQFGAYQLDGAKAVRAQLTADDEPLPDPDWPPAMEDHAVFFGGTDPGRFVPTYMIYSADYRPDVYLITQNALADGTYMSVERDLYGDEIWIPANEDNAAAFQEYVDSLTPEEKIRDGVVEVNGRVQVTGAQSVMKINAILTRRMFEKNSPRHAFYVEESYPIDWMYDYLTPHGLIMKLEPTKTSDDASAVRWGETLRKDRDFWDWYTRRLIDDPMYRRDFAGQKSFAKLRSAIAGLELNKAFRAYSSSRTIASASLFRSCYEQAFREACLLCPISPESTLRYVQTQRMALGVTGDTAGTRKALNVIEDLLDFIDEIDPHNKRTAVYRPSVNCWRNVVDLEERFGAPGATDVERAALALPLAVAYARVADLCRDEGSLQAAAQTTRMSAQLIASVDDRINDPSELAFAASVYADARMNDRAEQALKRYFASTRERPFSMQLLLARVYWRTDRKAHAVKLVRDLAAVNPKAFNELARVDAELKQMINESTRR